MSAALSYRDDIQGLRAIAVVSVLLFHAFPEHLSGGFVGVDIFFVISGFLISSILYRDMQTGRYSLADFYRKRIRRLFPALFTVLLITLAFGYFVLPPFEYRELARNTVSSTLFLSNVDFYLLSGYFSRMAEMKPLLHTWSLAVEEQFYIAFPPVLWLIHRYARHLLIPLILVLFGVSLLLAQLMLPRDPALVFYLSPFRVFELLSGVLVALMTLPTAISHRFVRELCAAGGLFIVFGTILIYSPEVPFPGVSALLPALGTALILLAGRSGETHVGRLISRPPFLFFGAISYSLYLWHWPILSYLKILTPVSGPSLWMTFTGVVLAIIAGTLSFRFIEQPVSRRNIHTEPFLRTGLAGMIIICTIAFGIRAADGLPTRFSPEASHFFAGAQDYSPARNRCHRKNQELAYEQTCILGASDANPSIVIFGDSHGVELAYALAERLKSKGLALRPITSSHCPPLLGRAFGECGAFNRKMLSSILSDPTVDTIILTMNAEAYLQEHDFEILREGFENTLDALHTTGKAAIIISQIPNINFDAAIAAGYAYLRGDDPTKIGRPKEDFEHTMARWTFAQTAQAHARGFTLFDPAPSLCNSTLCPAVGDMGSVIYFNPTHISVAGARLIADRLAPLL